MAESILYQKFQQIALLNIEEHYKDKFVYAIPEWTYLTTDPEIIGAVTIHGKEGVIITKKPVDFNVDFKNIISITEYIDFLNQKMNQDLPIIGYIVFFSYVLRVKKDKDYSKKLSQYQLDEIDKFNSNNNEFTISLFILNKDLKRVNDVVELE